MTGRRLLALLVVAGAVAVLPARPAGACSCIAGAPPPEVVFEGVSSGKAGEGWRFDVTRVDRGVLPDEIVVRMDVDVETRVEGGQAVIMSSSCSLGPAPEEGRRYRVAASSDLEGSRRRLVASMCANGALTPIGTTEPRPGPADDDDSRVEPIVLAATLLLVAAIFAVGRRPTSAG
jgi:hypothetical protein